MFDLSKFLSLSLWLMPFHCGSASGLEILAFLNERGLESRGMRWVSSPRQADVLLVAGPVPHGMLGGLERVYAQIPEPKILAWAHGRDADGEPSSIDRMLLGALPVDVSGPPETVFEGIVEAVKKRRGGTSEKNHG